MDNIVNRILAYATDPQQDEGHDGQDKSSSTSTTSCVIENDESIGKMEDVKVGMLCFSKDRPYQLHQFLRSVAQFYNPLPTDISILYLATEQHTTMQYRSMFNYHNSRSLPLRFIEETIFCDNLCEVIASWKQQQITHGIFCVDDLIFIQPVDIFTVGHLLNQHQDVFTYHLKLHPGILFSHASSKACPPPPLKAIAHSLPPTDEADNSYSSQYSLKFDYVLGKVDWRYPFDLCAALYRFEDIQVLLATITDVLQLDIKNPNLLEMYGNQAYWKLISTTFAKYRSAFCPPKAVLNVVTINKVQTTFDVPIFSSPSSTDDDWSLEFLNHQMLNIDTSANENDGIVSVVDKSRNFNFSQYTVSLNNLSVHIGDVYLEGDVTILTSLECLITVLLPVYNEEECLDRCLQSLLNTEQGVPFKILAINDGSTDRSQQILEEYQAQARLQGIAMEILTFTSNQGLVKALDEGINHCDTKFIARIDADDEILDGRLSKQLAFLLQHDGIYAVGCNAIVIESQEKKATTSFITTMPCHPILVAHGMFFNCQVLHPSVMFHTFIVKELGGYSITTSMHRDFSTIEDYALWTSLLQKYPLSIANIPDVGIKLRRRSNSKSHREYVPSVHAKQLLLQQFWTQFIDIQMGSRECEVAGMITSVDSMISDNDATDAIQLLQKMLETFEFKVLTDYDAKGDNKFILQQSLKAQHQKYQRQLTLDIKKRFPTWSSSKDKAKSSDGNVTTLASDSIFDALVSKLIT